MRVVNRISVIGVVAGGVTDIVLTALLTAPLVIYVTATSNLYGIADDQIAGAITAAVRQNGLLHIAQILIGGGCSILGGYVAARISKRHELLNGALSSFLCVLSGLYGWIVGHADIAAWEHVAWLLASPALGSLGGYIRLRTARANAPRSEA